MRATDRRLNRLETLARAEEPPLAIVDIVGLSEEEAERKVAERIKELERSGWRGYPPLLIVNF